MRTFVFIFLLYLAGLYPSYQWHKDRWKATVDQIWAVNGLKPPEWRIGDRNFCIVGAVLWPISVPAELVRGQLFEGIDQPANW